MAEVSEAQPGGEAPKGIGDVSGTSSAFVPNPSHQAPATSTELITPTTPLTTTTTITPSPPASSSSYVPSAEQETSVISGESQPPIAAASVNDSDINNVGVVNPRAAVPSSSLSEPESHTTASKSVYNSSVVTTLASESVGRNSVTTTQAYTTAQLAKTLADRLGSSLVSSGSSGVLLGSSTFGSSSGSDAIVSLAGSVFSSGETTVTGTGVLLSGGGVVSSAGSAVSSGGGLVSSGTGVLSGTNVVSKGGVASSGSQKKKKSSGKKASAAVVAAAAAAVAAAATSHLSSSSAGLSADDALAASAALESDQPGGISHRLLQEVRSTSLPVPLPVPTYSQTVQAARASGNVLAERATIIRETVKFFLGLKYWWTTGDYDVIAELVVNQFPELRDPVALSSTSCFNKVRLDLSMCARNIRRIAKNQEKRKGSPALSIDKEMTATTSSGQSEQTPPPPPPAAPKTSKGGGGKSRRKNSAALSVPTMVNFTSAGQMLPHTAHTAAVRTTLSSHDSKELANLPYLLTSTSPITTTTATTTTTTNCTVLPPVAHFLGHPSAHSHTTGGIVFPSLLPATHSTTPTTQPSPPPSLSPVSAVPKVSQADVGRTTKADMVGAQTSYADNALSLSGAWRADAQLPDPLPVPPYSEKVMKAKKMGVTKYERPLIIRETVLFFLSLKYWWSSVDYDRISHFVVDYFPDLKDPTLSPNMPPNRRVRTDLSQTARNMRRREVMIRRRDTRSPEDRFTAVGTVSLPPHSAQQVSNDFCNELLAAASFIERRTAALHQSDKVKALENHHANEVSRDSDAMASVLAHAGRDLQGSVSSLEDGKGEGGNKDPSENYPYSFLGAPSGGVDGGNCQLAVIKQEAGEAVDSYVQQQQQVLEAQASQAWLSAQAMSQALSMQALSSLSGLSAAHVSQALSDHLLSSQHTPTTLAPTGPPAAHQGGGEGLPTVTQTPPGYALSTPTSSTSTPSSLADTALSEASPVDRMSAMAMWRSTCLPEPLPVPPYSLNVLRARDSGNTSSARPRIIRETTQYYLALKMWWTTQDYERIAEMVLREFPDLKLVQNIKKDLGTCARNMRRRLPMTKSKQWATYQSPPSLAPAKEGGEEEEGGGVTLGELAAMASLREAQDKGRGGVGGGDEVGVVVSVPDDPRHSLLAGSVYDQNAWSLFYQQQLSAPDTPSPALLPPSSSSSSRSTKRSLSEATGTKGYEMSEKELTEALKQAVVQSVKQLGDMESGGSRRHSVDVGEASKLHDLKQESSGKAATATQKVTSSSSSSEASKSDSYPVMKELISHPAMSVRDPKVSTDYSTWTAHIGSVGEGGGAGGYQLPTPARAHSQPACPLRSDVSISESEEVPMNLTCAPPTTSEGPKRGKSPKAIKTEVKSSKKGGADTFSAREQVWFPHGSPWKKSGQNMFKGLPTPLPVPKYTQKLLKAREEGLAYRHRSEIIRETARFFLVLKYWWSSADYSRISELVVQQYPDLKDPVTPPGQPFYRRVQRDLSMCARNLRRKNTRQQQQSSGETGGGVTIPKKMKGSSKEKKSKKVTSIKVEAISELSALQAAGELAGLGTRVGEGAVVGSGVGAATPLAAISSSSSLTQAMLQASVDHALASISPLPNLPTTTTTATQNLSWALPQQQQQQQHVTSSMILSHLVSPITATPASLAHPTTITTLPAPTHTTTTTTTTAAAATYPYTAAQPPAYSAVHTTVPSSAHTVSVVVAAPGSVSGGKEGAKVDRMLWPLVVPANGLSESAGNSSKTKKKSAAVSKLSPASSKPGQVAAKLGHGSVPKSVANIQPKMEKSVAPVSHTPHGESADQGGRGRALSEGGVGHVSGGSSSSSSKRSKDSVRHLTSRSGEGRAQSNTTAIVTPTLSEVHASTPATSSEGSNVGEKVYINPEHGTQLQRQLTQLWQDGKFFDASLEVDNYRLPAHKLVLLAASPYLQHTFKNANPTSQLEVNLPRATGVEAARDFLKYLYQGVLHVAPGTVQALRRIASMLQIQQLLVYCDDFLLQLSAGGGSGGSGGSGMSLPHHRTSLPHSHAPAQVKRVSVNLREPAHAQPLTTEHNPSQPLPANTAQVSAGTSQFGLSADHHHHHHHHHPPTQTVNARKRKSTSLASSSLDGHKRYLMDGEGREGVSGYSGHAEDEKQRAFEGSGSRQTVELVKCFRSEDGLGVEPASSSSSSSSSSKAYLDSQAPPAAAAASSAVVGAYERFSNSWHRPADSHTDGRQHSVLAQHLSTEKSHHGGRPLTSSVIHRGPNLLAASSSSAALQGELTTTTATTSLTTVTTTGSSNNGNSSDAAFTNSNGSMDEGARSMIQYLTDASQSLGEGEEGVLVRLLPEGVQMEIGGEGAGGMHFHPQAHPHAMHITAPHAIQLSGEQAIQLSGEQAIQLSGEQAIQLSGEQAIQLSGEQAIQLSGEQAIQLSGEQAIHLSREQAIQLSEQALQLSGEQAIQLAGGEQAIHLSREQAIQLGRDTAIHLGGGEGGAVHHLTCEEALQLVGQAAEQSFRLSEQTPSSSSEQEQQQQLLQEHLLQQQEQQQQQLLQEQEQQQQQLVTLSQKNNDDENSGGGGEMAMQLVDQSMAMRVVGGGEGEEVTLVEQAGGREEEDDGMVVGEGSRHGVYSHQERWEEEVVVQGGEGEEMMVEEEVIVQSGDLLQDVDVAACETVECSLLPQTYCSSPEGVGEEEEGEQQVVEECPELLVEAERMEENGGEQAEAALQTLASQWVRQQYAKAPLDADTARQFEAVLQERMYGQQQQPPPAPPSSTTTPSLHPPPPPAYSEALYIQQYGGDGETMYVSQAMEGEELVVETSVVTEGAAAGVGGTEGDGGGNEDESHASLLPQTYCSGSSPRSSHSPSVST